MDRGARRVLARVTHGVASHRRLVRLTALTTVLACLDIFLGIVPGAAAVVKEERHQDACARRKHQETCQGFGTQQLPAFV